MSAISNRRVAIWGSSATHDTYQLASRQAQLAASCPLVHYSGLSSWVSQASTPLPVPQHDLAGTFAAVRAMVTDDFNKGVMQKLVRAKPDIVVLDLIEERHTLLRTDTTWLTLTDFVRRTPAGARVQHVADDILDADSDEERRLRLFEAAVRLMASRLRKALPQATFVLHEAPFAANLAGGMSLPMARVAQIERLQYAHAMRNEIVARYFGERLVRLSPSPELVMLDPVEHWTRGGLGYAEPYRHWLVDELLRLPEQAIGEASGVATHWWNSSPSATSTRPTPNTLPIPLPAFAFAREEAKPAHAPVVRQAVRPAQTIVVTESMIDTGEIDLRSIQLPRQGAELDQGVVERR